MQGYAKESIVCFQRALSLQPGFEAAQCNLGFAMQTIGLLNEAVALWNTVLRTSPCDAEAHLNLSLVELLRGDFQAGWANYEWRWQVFPKGQLGRPRWRGEPLLGKRILLHAEQGLGDTLQFLRYVRLVQSARGEVVLEVPVRLRHRYSRRSWPPEHMSREHWARRVSSFPKTEQPRIGLISGRFCLAHDVLFAGVGYPTRAATASSTWVVSSREMG